MNTGIQAITKLTDLEKYGIRLTKIKYLDQYTDNTGRFNNSVSSVFLQ